MKSEALKRAQANYSTKHTMQVNITFSELKDPEVVQKLRQMKNSGVAIPQYVKELIKKDLSE